MIETFGWRAQLRVPALDCHPESTEGSVRDLRLKKYFSRKNGGGDPSSSRLPSGFPSG